MNDRTRLKPLAIGRVSRIVAGIAAIGVAIEMGYGLGWLVLMALGVSFLVGGVIGNPGCEITALPNLFRPRSEQAYCP